MIEKYTFQREIDGQWYAVELPAKDFEDAELIMNAIGGRMLGKVLEQRTVCDECFNQLVCFECDDLKEGFLPPNDIPLYRQ